MLRRFRLLLLSAAIHAGLLVLLFFYAMPVWREQPALPPLFIDVEKPVAVSPSRGSGVGGRAKQRSQFPKLSALGVPFEKPAKQGETAPAGSGAEQALSGEVSSLERYIYSSVDARLTYPSELREHGDQGTVFVKVYLDRDGLYRRDLSRIDASNEYLRVHVLRVLRLALAEPLPSQFVKNHEPITLECSFGFFVTQNNDSSLIKARKLIVGKALFFYRSFYRSKLEWDLGPLHGLGPFGAAINPAWFFEKAKDMLSNRAKIDPLQKYRDDPEW